MGMLGRGRPICNKGKCCPSFLQSYSLSAITFGYEILPCISEDWLKSTCVVLSHSQWVLSDLVWADLADMQECIGYGYRDKLLRG